MWDARQRSVGRLLPLVANLRACTGAGAASSCLEALEQQLASFRDRVGSLDTLTLRCLQCVQAGSVLHAAASAHIAAIEGEVASGEAAARVVETLVLLGLLQTTPATTRVLECLLPERRLKRDVVTISQLCMRDVRQAKATVQDLLSYFSSGVLAFLKWVFSQLVDDSILVHLWCEAYRDVVHLSPVGLPGTSPPQPGTRSCSGNSCGTWKLLGRAPLGMPLKSECTTDCPSDCWGPLAPTPLSPPPSFGSWQGVG
jgi:hypothetical protein